MQRIRRAIGHVLATLAAVSWPVAIFLVFILLCLAAALGTLLYAGGRWAVDEFSSTKATPTPMASSLATATPSPKLITPTPAPTATPTVKPAAIPNTGPDSEE